MGPAATRTYLLLTCFALLLCWQDMQQETTNNQEPFYINLDNFPAADLRALYVDLRLTGAKRGLPVTELIRQILISGIREEQLPEIQV